MLQHVLYSRESAFGTWVTPAKLVPSEAWGIRSAREQLKFRDTGGFQGVFQAVPGAKAVSGPWRFKWRPINTLAALGAWFRTNASTLVDTGVYDHGLLINNEAALLGLSMQAHHASTLALNGLSCVPTKLTFSFASKQPAIITADMLAKDEVRSGGTWDYDGVTAAPAIVAVATSSYDPKRPLMFYDAALVLGGTPTLNGTTKLWSVAAGTTYSKFHMVEIAFDFGMDADAFALANDPTIAEIWPGERSVAVKLESSWTDLSTTFYDAFRAGTEMALQIKLAGPTISGAYKYEGEITIPNLHFDPDNIFPDIGDQSRPKSAISGEAVLNLTAGYDFGIRVRSSEATI